ncbi:MAG: DUF2946 family protein [Paracoccaceae bacterium]
MGAVAMRLLALLAMLLQVALFTDHIGASAVAGVQGPQLAGAQHSGLLQICTGEGVVLLGPDGSRAPTQGNGGHGGGSCPVCSSSSMCSFDAPAAVAAPVFQAELVAPPFLPIRHDQVQALHQRVLAPIRAPPLA